MNPTPYLRLNTGKDLPLVGRNCWTIGRGKDNDLVIREQWISRNHAMLQCTESGDFYLIDLGSRNGTFVNGRRVSIPVTLKDTDQVMFGKTELEFHSPNRNGLGSGSENNFDSDIPTLTLHLRRLISIMVVDIRDFTVLARQLDETILSSVMGNWFREAGNIIRSSGSWVDKYIGDAVMAIWFHGKNEVASTELLQIFQAVSNLNKMTASLSEQYPLPFELRIGAGVNTGYAMVGNTGSGDRPDYTAIGDTVNFTFRLESATKEIGSDIVLGESTYGYLSELAQGQELFVPHTVKLKGYDAQQKIYAANFEDLDKL